MIQTVANSGALGKSQKTNAQSGLVGPGDKHIVAHFQVPSALAPVATRLDSRQGRSGSPTTHLPLEVTSTHMSVRRAA